LNEALAMALEAMIAFMVVLTTTKVTRVMVLVINVLVARITPAT
jgi:hypothetical protein